MRIGLIVCTVLGCLAALLIWRGAEESAATASNAPVINPAVEVDEVEQGGGEPELVPDLATSVAVSPRKPQSVTPYERAVAPVVRGLVARLEVAAEDGVLAPAEINAALQGPFLRVDPAGRIQLYLHAAPISESLRAELAKLGVEVELVSETTGKVQAWVPYSLVRQVATLADISRVAAPSYPHHATGSTVTEGDVVHLTNELRALGITGEGVRVGIISDGSRDRTQSQALGELPGHIVTYGLCVPREEDLANCFRGFSCNEGTAIAEIVHDIAPDAALAIAASGTSLEFVERVNLLVNDFGADVIIDDIGYFGEPFFADGDIAMGVAAITDDVVYVSSAGNGADDHYEANYVARLVEGISLHNFGSAEGAAVDTSLDFTVEPGGYLLTFMQWNDEFGTSANDYDLFYTEPDGLFFLCPACGSQALQTGAGDPFEAVCYHNPGASDVDGDLLVARFSGAVRTVEMFMVGPGVELEYNHPGGSVFGHAAVREVLAVGAINYSDPGHDDATEYSARGPARVDFPALEERPKPDIIAIDGVSVTGTGGFPSEFFGTSASAPHVAAIAGLLKHAAPDATAADLRAALLAGAVDIGPPGRDSVNGEGRADARRAMAALRPGYADDSDGDGVVDLVDAFAANPGESRDTDGDGIGNGLDSDDDNDGHPDSTDRFPLIAEEHADADGDGAGDNSDFELESEFNGARGFANPFTRGVVGNIDTFGDVDWYSFETTGPAAVEIILSIEEEQTFDHWVVAVTDATGNVVAGVNTTDGKRLLASIASAGTWFVEVSVNNSVIWREDEYVLTMDRLPDRAAVEQEPNENQAQATPVALGRIEGQLHDVTDADWYQIEVGESTTLDVTVSIEDPAPLDRWEATLRNAAGDTIATAQFREETSFSETVAGEVFLSIEAIVVNSYGSDPYVIDINCARGAGADHDCDGLTDAQDPFPEDVRDLIDTDGDGLADNIDPDDDNDGVPDEDDPDPLDPSVGPQSRLHNISTRGYVGSGDDVLIGGVIIAGETAKDVLIRARGPSLGDADPNLQSVLGNPGLQLFAGGQLINSNEDWEQDARAGEIMQPLRPAYPAEAAILATLQPGAYTAIVRGTGEGIGIVEVFEVNDTGTTRLSNISTRGQVGAGDDVLIGGLIISGSSPRTVTVRARGPSMAAADPGLAALAIEDPLLQLFDASGSLIDSNDNWEDHLSTTSLPAALQPGDAREAAITITLQPGAYTAIVRGVGGTTGIGIVEVFEVD